MGNHWIQFHPEGQLSWRCRSFLQFLEYDDREPGDGLPTPRFRLFLLSQSLNLLLLLAHNWSTGYSVVYVTWTEIFGVSRVYQRWIPHSNVFCRHLPTNKRITTLSAWGGWYCTLSANISASQTNINIQPLMTTHDFQPPFLYSNIPTPRVVTLSVCSWQVRSCGHINPLQYSGSYLAQSDFFLFLKVC